MDEDLTKKIAPLSLHDMGKSSREMTCLRFVLHSMLTRFVLEHLNMSDYILTCVIPMLVILRGYHGFGATFLS